MKTVVYADILFVINTIINYLLLRASTFLIGCSYRTYRIMISAITGGLFSLIIYIDNIPPLLNIIIKITFMTIMIFIAFEIKSIKIFIKNFASFFTVNMLFGGLMLAINIFLLPNSALYNNGVVYFDIDIMSLTVSSVVCYVILNLVSKFIKSKSPANCIYPIKITYKNSTVEGKALYDSGNTLCDCFSSRPVIIADLKFIEKLIISEKTEKTRNFRLIPYTTIKGSGTLQAFMADRVDIYITGQWKGAEKIYIGITENKIISGNYSALIGSPYLDMIKK